MYKIEGPEDGGKSPNGPNFLLIVILSLVTILIGFAIALVMTGRVGRLIHPLRSDHHPEARLVTGQSGSVVE
jgi:hypothetical protein